MPQKYTTIAPFYDLLSGEWPVYGAGRAAGIPLLRLTPGDHVLDVGCGTGLNFPLLRRAVTASGRVVGVDSSADMLRAARTRVDHDLDGEGAGTVELVEHDATDLGALRGGNGPFEHRLADAVLFTYALSLMRPWPAAWAGALSLARTGARVVVVDMARPTGGARLLEPLALLATHLGGSDIDAHPWTALEQQCVDVSHQILRGGHLQVWAGTWPGA